MRDHQPHPEHFQRFHEHGDHPAGVFFLFLLLLFLVWLAAFLIIRKRQRKFAAANPVVPTHAAAESILHERFAKGEIHADEYQHRLWVLRNPASPLTAVADTPLAEAETTAAEPPAE